MEETVGRKEQKRMEGCVGREEGEGGVGRMKRKRLKCK